MKPSIGEIPIDLRQSWLTCWPQQQGQIQKYEFEDDKIKKVQRLGRVTGRETGTGRFLRTAMLIPKESVGNKDGKGPATNLYHIF